MVKSIGCQRSAVIIATVIWMLIGIVLTLIGIATGWFPKGAQFMNC